MERRQRCRHPRHANQCRNPDPPRRTSRAVFIPRWEGGVVNVDNNRNLKPAIFFALLLFGSMFLLPLIEHAFFPKAYDGEGILIIYISFLALPIGMAILPLFA